MTVPQDNRRYLGVRSLLYRIIYMIIIHLIMRHGRLDVFAA